MTLYYKGQPIVQCLKCGTRYKVKNHLKKIINIVLFVGFIMAVILKFTLDINIFIALVIVYGAGFIVTALMIILDDYCEKVTNEHSTQGSENEI